MEYQKTNTRKAINEQSETQREWKRSCLERKDETHSVFIQFLDLETCIRGCDISVRLMQIRSNYTNTAYLLMHFNVRGSSKARINKKKTNSILLFSSVLLVAL